MASIAASLQSSLPKPKYTGEDEETPAHAHAWPRRVSSLPTTSRFRRQAAARFFSSQLQSPVAQQPRHLLLPRSNAPPRGKYAETKSKPQGDPGPESVIKQDPIEESKTVESVQEQKCPSPEQAHLPEIPTAESNKSANTPDETTPLHSELTPATVAPTREEDDAPADATLTTPFDQDCNDFSSDESLQDSEDIDFEFVYALHTFVATVEGQANATKGDTMVLLDDSNSYWWLVRVVKDSSIGYLPAEHIETPTERLARLNKHRNIDLSATMLGDQAAKQKTTFKGIRRKRKTVAFSEPTYVDYSDFDYSTDEEDIEELFGTQPQSAREQAAQSVQENQDTADEARVEPLRTRGSASDEDTKATNGTEKTAGKDGLEKDDSGQLSKDGDDDTSSVEEIIDETTAVSRSRNGTVRNTDSFFNDEETKKITLTPNLLRDGDTGGAVASRPSTDSLGKDSTKEDQGQEAKRHPQLLFQKGQEEVGRRRRVLWQALHGHYGR
ncbi:hypothetical protein NLG97_g3219 [Lecanicillium saksenae]|uniref:Uncharacterized protein n=1 Tax=Lecanicillium saksenae TaxID=468837 RepID=A0ACC1R0G0_9HYPO|nr:hypothetical protein NLG97_g3219 [Lecanicillium saksenae]